MKLTASGKQIVDESQTAIALCNTEEDAERIVTAANAGIAEEPPSAPQQHYVLGPDGAKYKLILVSEEGGAHYVPVKRIYPKIVAALSIPSFQSVIDNIAMDGVEGMPDDLIPEPIRATRDFIKEKLSAAEESYQEHLTRAVMPLLSEAELDAIIAFNQTDVGKKLGTLTHTMTTVQMRDEVVEMPELLGVCALANEQWRNETLEPHSAELSKLLGIEEPLAKNDDDPLSGIAVVLGEAPNGTTPTNEELAAAVTIEPGK